MKRTVWFVLILMIIAALLLPAVTMAQAARKDVRIAVLVQQGLKEKDLAGADNTTLERIFRSLTYIYPDYCNVTLDFYRVENIRAVNSANNIWPITSCTRGEDGFDAALENLLSTANSMSKPAQTYKNLDEVMTVYAGRNVRLLVVGNYNGNNYITSDKMPAEVPCVLLNVAETETGLAQYEMKPEKGRELEIAYQIYSLYDTDAYYQKVYSFTTEDYICTLEAATDATEVISRKILVDTTVSQENPDPALTLTQPGNGLTVITAPNGGAVEFMPASKENGLVTVVVATQKQPYISTVSQTAGETVSHTMNEQLELTVAFEQIEDSASAFRFDASEWAVTADIIGDNWNRQLILEPDGMVFKATVACEDLGPGSGKVTIKTVNKAEPFLTRQETEFPLEITNSAAAYSGGNGQSFSIWDNAPVAPNNDLTMDLNGLYTDDGGNDRLIYSLEGDLAEAAAIGSDLVLRLDPEKIKNDGTITVVVTDKAGISNRDLVINVKYYDVSTMLVNDPAMMRMLVDGTEQASACKDSTVEAEATYTVPEDIRCYIDLLRTQNKMSSLSELLDVRAIVKGSESLNSRIDYEDDYSIRFIVTDNGPSPVGPLHMGLNLYLVTGPELVSYAGDIEVVNRAPAYTATLLDQPDHEISIPGPFFLNQDKDVETVTLKLDEILQTEVLDQITVLVETEPALGLYTDPEGRYVLTDATETEGLVSVEKIVWNTEDPAPELQIRITQRSNVQMSLSTVDDCGASPENDPVVLNFAVRYYNEQLMIMIAAGIAAAILLLILILVIRQILKPSFKPGETLHVKYGDYEADIGVEHWKKKGLTLRDVLIYAGVPVVGDIPLKECTATMVMPGRKTSVAEIRRKGKWTIGVTVNGAEQNKKSIRIRTGTVAEINLAEGKQLLLSGQQ